MNRRAVPCFGIDAVGRKTRFGYAAREYSFIGPPGAVALNRLADRCRKVLRPSVWLRTCRAGHQRQSSLISSILSRFARALMIGRG
jgi:hypothetical protein